MEKARRLTEEQVPEDHPRRPWVVLKGHRTRGGVKQKLPGTLPELMALGRNILQVEVVGARYATTGQAIVDLDSVPENTMIILTTTQDEQEFAALGL